MPEVSSFVARLRAKLEAEQGPLSAVYAKRRHGHRLLWPPASPRAVAAAQRRLGFELPPLLSAVYQGIGNGGLALRLMGLRGGQCGFDDIGYAGKDIVRGYFDTVEHTRLFRDGEAWPAGRVPIYDGLGCGMADYCDCTTPEGRVWRWDSPGGPPWVEDGLTVEYPSLAAYWDLEGSGERPCVDFG